MEYEVFGEEFTPVSYSCRNWARTASDACDEHCGDCDLVAKAVKDICRFTLQVILASQGSSVNTYCDATHASFLHHRCPPYCADEGQVDQVRCDSDTEANLDQCMSECGNFYGCTCRTRRGTLMPDICDGITILQGPVPGRIGLLYSCDLTPLNCRHDKQAPDGTTSCGLYRTCTLDLCAVGKVNCTSDNQCRADGLCNKPEGRCYFTDLPLGTPCDDGIPYTVNDHCSSGQCIGTVNNCLKHNVSCEPATPCVRGGVCNPTTGFCDYQQVADWTYCDDGREYTVEDRCFDGFCLGQIADLCVERNVRCTTAGDCWDPGTCDPQSGQCGEAVPVSDRLCDDGDPLTQNDTCIDGVCVGHGISDVKFLTLGNGECSDRNGLRMAKYSGDVVDEAECEGLCRGDAQCMAYEYSFPLCSIYGTVRTRAPAGREWVFEDAPQPSALIIETVKAATTGQRLSICRRKGDQEDAVDTSIPGKINYEVAFAPILLVVFFALLTGLFLARPLYNCTRRLIFYAENPLIIDVGTTYVSKQPSDETLRHLADTDTTLVAPCPDIDAPPPWPSAEKLPPETPSEALTPIVLTPHTVDTDSTKYNTVDDNSASGATEVTSFTSPRDRRERPQVFVPRGVDGEDLEPPPGSRPTTSQQAEREEAMKVSDVE